MAQSNPRRTITPAEFAQYARENNVDVIYPSSYDPQPKGRPERLHRFAARDFALALRDGSEKLCVLLGLMPADEAERLGQTLLSSFAATLDEEQSTLLLVTLFAIPSFSELLDRHISDAISHVEGRAVAKGKSSPSGPEVSDLISEG